MSSTSVPSTIVENFRQFLCLHRRNLLFHFVFRNLKVKYRGSFFGYFWTLLIPLFQILVFYFVYQVIMKVPVPNYLAFLVTGILPWIFFASTVTESFESLVSGQQLLSQVPVPIQAFPAASVVTNFVNFLLSLPVMLGVVLFSGIAPSWPIILMIPLCMGLFLLTYCLAFIFASLFVLFRDLKHLFSIVVQLWLYATPVLYSADMIPQSFRWMLFANPLCPFFICLRKILLDGTWPPTELLWIFSGWLLFFYVLAELIRQKLGPRLVEYL